MTSYNRRKFIKTTAATGIGLGLVGNLSPLFAKSEPSGKRIGIIGLDTSHSVEFTKALNGPDASADFGGYKIVAAYPQGSLDIQSSISRIPGYTEEVKKRGVEIVNSIPALLEKTDVILLETNDGRRHLEQGAAHHLIHALGTGGLGALWALLAALAYSSPQRSARRPAVRLRVVWRGAVPAGGRAHVVARAGARVLLPRPRVRRGGRLRWLGLAPERRFPRRGGGRLLRYPDCDCWGW